MEQGGDKWVIGGTLEIKEGASVTGLPAAEVPQAANQADSVAEDVSTLVSDFNGLLAKLKADGSATMDYTQFSKMASYHSARLVEALIEKLLAL